MVNILDGFLIVIVLSTCCFFGYDMSTLEYSEPYTVEYHVTHYDRENNEVLYTDNDNIYHAEYFNPWGAHADDRHHYIHKSDRNVLVITYQDYTSAILGDGKDVIEIHLYTNLSAVGDLK